MNTYTVKRLEKIKIKITLKNWNLAKVDKSIIINRLSGQDFCLKNICKQPRNLMQLSNSYRTVMLVL